MPNAKPERPMKFSVAALFLFLLSTATAQQSVSLARMELTIEDPHSLIGIVSSNLSVYGLHIGMRQADAKSILSSDDTLIGEVNSKLPNRIAVHELLENGETGQSLMNLIWVGGDDALDQIVLWNGLVPRVGPTMGRFLSLETFDPNSEFIRDFVGAPHRSEVTFSMPIIKATTTTYSYEAIGVEIAHNVRGEKESVSLSLVADARDCYWLCSMTSGCDIDSDLPVKYSGARVEDRYSENTKVPLLTIGLDSEAGWKRVCE